MKTRSDVNPDKLRGGFYTPDSLVNACLDRVIELVNGRDRLAVLEPSAGDGAFVRGLGRHPVGALVGSVTAIELLPTEAAKVAEVLNQSPFAGQVINASSLAPESIRGSYDVAVGNPPFVRYQFVSDEERRNIGSLAARVGVPFTGVSNLWIPVFLSALNSLRDGGVFSFVVPAECFTGLSARAVRSWLASHAIQLRVDLFAPKSFPNVLQEVVVLSGEVSRGSTYGAKVFVQDHGLGYSWQHSLDDDSTTWTGLLLRPEHLLAFAEVRKTAGVHQFSSVAKLSVATVTGANSYFCVDEATRAANDLQMWTRPLLDRARHAPGLEYGYEEHARNLSAGRPVWILDSSLSERVTPGAEAYIDAGEAHGLHTRYKTRIRTPWWKVPVVNPGTLMLSKRSNDYPRLIRNELSVVTTDTIYQGSPLPAYAGRERDIVGSFHNSLTLLTAELFGRSFGGGVLELVPSEVALLLLPLTKIRDSEFVELDALMRSTDTADEVVRRTDELIITALGIDPTVWALVEDARRSLRDRRFARN